MGDQASDVVAAQAMLLKSVAIVAGSELDCERARGAIRAALADLDGKLLAGDWQALAHDAAWLIDQARRGRG
jgi:hypothetical protein